MNLTNDVKKSWALLREGFLSEVRASQDTEYIHAFYIIDRAITQNHEMCDGTITRLGNKVEELEALLKNKEVTNEQSYEAIQDRSS